VVYGAGLENLWVQALRGSNPLPTALVRGDPCTLRHVRTFSQSELRSSWLSRLNYKVVYYATLIFGEVA